MKFRVNKLEFPIELTKVQGEFINMMLDYRKRRQSFKGFIEHVEEPNILLAWAFIGWFNMNIDRPTTQPNNDSFVSFFNDILEGKTK